MEGSYGSYGCWVADGCPGRVSRPQSYGWFPWMVPVVSMVVGLRMAAQVGVPDRMSVHVLDEEQLAPLRVR